MSDVVLDGLPYAVIVCDDAGARIADALAECGPIAVVFDERVRRRARALVRALRGAGHTVAGELPVRGGERCKSTRALEGVWRWLVEKRAHRATTLLAVGGGTVTDLAGFAAATFMRGIAWAAVPTTVLGMADAAIGGKTAIDLPQGKNLAGAFWPPRVVLADLAALPSLPPRERATGLAEIVKAAVIADAGLLEAVGAVAARPDDMHLWRAAIVRAARVKIDVVAIDPGERGARAALNLGHTIGHAIEHAAGGRLSHGEAVAIGLRGAGLTALRTGRFSRREHARVLHGLALAGLPVHDGKLDLAAVMRALATDKKRGENGIRFVLPKHIGRVEIDVAVPEKLVRAVVRQCSRPPLAEELG
ncbi:MAG TPA: 3-dehydroquinate synthase family protein [Candidatus Eremiobacteraceae bacterium]|nr:3-dehydroquinate synthase family protein [Candidatus Eremiobacteraceae bacterium]